MTHFIFYLQILNRRTPLKITNYIISIKETKKIVLKIIDFHNYKFVFFFSVNCI